MKNFFYLFLGSALLFSCTQTTFIDDTRPADTVVVQGSDTIEYRNKSIEKRPGLAIVQFEIQTDYPSGPARALTVWDGGTIVTNKSRLPHGQYSFRIEQRGYETLVKDVWVDSDFDGKYTLVGMLRAKERLIQFNIMDSSRNVTISPDKVTIANMGWSQEQQTVTNGSFVKPGQKLIVINKNGYADYTQEVEIPVGEEPFTLTAFLNPN